MGYQIHNFQNHKSGTTFMGTQFELLINASPADLTGAKIYLNTSAKVLSTETGEILITDAVNGKFKINKQVLTIQPSTYDYDITIVFASGDIKTYIKGTWTIF